MLKYIQNSIKNNSRFILKHCTKPQKKAMNELIRGLYVENEPILRHLAQNPNVSAKKQGDKYGYHLENVDLKSTIEDFSMRRVLPSIRKDTIIAYDLTDIAKPSAKKMKGLSTVFDGSKREVTNGYFLHGVGINHMLVRLEKHDANTNTLNQVRKEVIEDIDKYLDGKGIWVFDRGNDDKQFFKYLEQEVKLQFIARLRVNRYVILKETGVQIKVSELEYGTHEVYLLNNRNKVDKDTLYTVVRRKHLENKKPIIVLHNLKEEYTDEEIVTMYLERWGVENRFKEAKKKFKLERIRVLNETRLVNLIALVQFVLNVATLIFMKLQQVTTQIVSGVILAYKQFIKLKSLSLNLCSFISFLTVSLPPLIHRKKPPPNQQSLFSSRQLEKLRSF